MFGGPLREIENVSTCTFTCYSLCTHCPFISNPQFSSITLSPIQTSRFETRCTVYNRGLGSIGDLGLSGVLLSGKRYLGTWACRGVGIRCTIGELDLSGTWVYRGFCYRGKDNRGLGPVGELGLGVLSGVLLSGSFHRGKVNPGLGLSG